VKTVNKGKTVTRRGANLERVRAVQLGRGLTEGNEVSEAVMVEGFFISVLVFVFSIFVLTIYRGHKPCDLVTRGQVAEMCAATLRSAPLSSSEHSWWRLVGEATGNGGSGQVGS